MRHPKHKAPQFELPKAEEVFNLAAAPQVTTTPAAVSINQPAAPDNEDAQELLAFLKERNPTPTARRTSPRTRDAIWLKFECGAGSRWTSTTEDSTGCLCNFSGCNCGTLVRFMGETDDRSANWFGLRVGGSAKTRQ